MHESPEPKGEVIELKSEVWKLCQCERGCVALGSMHLITHYTGCLSMLAASCFY